MPLILKGIISHNLQKTNVMMPLYYLFLGFTPTAQRLLSGTALFKRNKSWLMPYKKCCQVNCSHSYAPILWIR